MTRHHLYFKDLCIQLFLGALAPIFCFSTTLWGANIIIGSVHNLSRGEPASGDDVILVRLVGGMHEEARTKADAQGAFTLAVQRPDKPYLVRVIHQGVNYDQQVFPGRAISIQVFDAAPKIRGVTGTIEILRTETKNNLLHVSDMVEIRNASKPPLTQVGRRTFEIYLPTEANLDSVLAAGPGKIGEMISATPITGEQGHYAVNFPLRPGATKFAFNYDLPYPGRVAFHTKLAYPLQQLAVMVPPALKFSSRAEAFQILATGNAHYEVHAASQLEAGEGPAFEISGTLALPPPLSTPSSYSKFSLSPVAPRPTKSPPANTNLPLLVNISSRSELARPPTQSRVLGGLTVSLLAACVLIIFRARKPRSFSPAQKTASRNQQRRRTAA